MLRALRRRLALLSALLTGAVLLAMGLSALSVAQRQLRSSADSAFQSNLNAIAAKLMSDRVISFTWLAQTEAAEGLVVSLWDGGAPLFFPGAWTPKTDRNVLVARAEAAGRRQGVDVALPPLSVIDVTSVTFEITGDHGDRYLAAAALIPGLHGWQSLVLLRDMGSFDSQVLQLRLAFALLTVLGVAALFASCWYFAGRAILPIEESQRKQAEFIAAASHELRSPLAVIRTSAEAAAVEPELAPALLGSIGRECGRMARLVDDLLTLARGDAGSWSVRHETVDLDALLLETAELFCPLAREKGQTLTLVVPDTDLPSVMGDAQRLKQVLTILLDNAFTYTPAGGTITLSGYAQGRWVVLRAADTGPGIPAEHLPRVFDRFYRGDLSRTAKEHFGLGLSIAAELARLHAGSLRVAESSEKGTVFELRLPAKGI